MIWKGCQRFKLNLKLFFLFSHRCTKFKDIAVVSITTDMTWTRTRWEPPATKSSHVTHFQSPQQPSTVINNYKILQCNKMAVQAKHSDSAKVQQVRKEYRGPVHSKNDPKKLKFTVPFVTKVQIKKTTAHFKSRPKSTIVKRETTLQQIFDRENEEETDVDEVDEKCKKIEDNQREDYKKKTHEIGSPLVKLKLKRAPRIRRACYSALAPVEQTGQEENESVDKLIKILTRKMNDRSLVSLGAKTNTIPVAAFARPTKGEIALSKKRPKPVVAASTNEAKMMQSASVMPSLRISLSNGTSSDSDSLPRDTILRGSSARSVPGLVSPRATPRVPWSAPERISSLSFSDPGKPLCYCCRNAQRVQISDGSPRLHDRQKAARGNSHTVSVRMPVEGMQPYDQSHYCASVESFSESSLELDSGKEACFTRTPVPPSSPVQEGDM